VAEAKSEYGVGNMENGKVRNTLRSSARPMVFVWLAVMLGIMWMIEQLEGQPVPTEAKAFIMAYIGEWLIERGIRKSRGEV